MSIYADGCSVFIASMSQDLCLSVPTYSVGNNIWQAYPLQTTFFFQKQWATKMYNVIAPMSHQGLDGAATWRCLLQEELPQAFYSAIKMTNPDHLSKHFKKWGALLLIFVRGTHSCAWDIFAFSSLHFNCMLLVCCLTKYCSFLPPLSSAKCDRKKWLCLCFGVFLFFSS